VGRRKRALLIDTLTEIYREETSLYEGIADLLRLLLDDRYVRVGVLTRNITNEPTNTLRRLFQRNGIDPDGFDFFVHVPLSEDKTEHFKAIRQHFSVNPARSYACGDEKKDFLAAVQTGMHPFMVSYGFEDFERLTTKIGVPPELISRDPAELKLRVAHALDLRG
jgi:phosphoglycolate phosphatase